MADETPQPTSAPSSGGGESGGEQQAAEKPKGGLASFLPLIIVLVLMPVLAWGVITIKSKMDQKRAAAPDAENAEPAKVEKAEAENSHGGGGHGGGGHGGSKEKKKRTGGVQRNTKLPIPLTRDAVAYHPRDDSKDGDYDKIVVLDLKGEPRDEAKSDKIIVNIANTGGTRFAVTRVSLVGEHQDLIERVNQNRERLLDRASGLLEMKTQDDVEKPGFRSLLKAELLSTFNEILGRGTLQEVIITEFVIQ